MKKILLIAGAVLILFSGCPKKATSGSQAGSSKAAVGGKLVIWSFTDELANMTNNPQWGFKATHPGIDVEYSQTPSDQFQAKIDPVLANGQGAPDIIALESAFVRKYVESGLLLDVTDIYEANKAKLLPTAGAAPGLAPIKAPKT